MRHLVIPKKYRHKIKTAALDIQKSTDSKYQSQIVQNQCLPMVVGPKADKVFQLMHDQFFGRMHFLAIDEFCERWHLDGNSLYFGQQIISTTGTYYRSPEVTESYEFRQELEIFEDQLPWICSRVLGSPHYAINNFSKAQQYCGSIRNASRYLSEFYHPKSLVTMNAEADVQTIRTSIGEGILKGLSCLRTQVIEERLYKRLPISKNNQTPTLFQERLIGDEIRVHIIDGKYFPLLIKKNAGTVDYRYSVDSEYTENVVLTEQEGRFCDQMVREEQNPLLGIDLIRTPKGTACFEANPNPGWACFNYSKTTLSKMGRAIFEYLGAQTHEQ